MTFHILKILHLVTTIMALMMMSAVFFQEKRHKIFFASTLSILVASLFSGMIMIYRWKFHYGEIPMWILIKSVLFVLLATNYLLSHRFKNKKAIPFGIACVLTTAMILLSILKPV